MAWTSGQLAALERAIASGAQTVEFEGQRTTYRSLADMLVIRDSMRRELGLTPKTDGRTIAVVNKGFGGPTSTESEGFHA